MLLVSLPLGGVFGVLWPRSYELAYTASLESSACNGNASSQRERCVSTYRVVAGNMGHRAYEQIELRLIDFPEWRGADQRATHIAASNDAFDPPGVRFDLEARRIFVERLQPNTQLVVVLYIAGRDAALQARKASVQISAPGRIVNADPKLGAVARTLAAFLSFLN